MKLRNLGLKNYPRDRRGVASLESALGAVVMVTASLLALDLYRLADTQTTIMHVAVSVADTVSREEPPGLTETELRQKMDAFVQSLAELLHKEQFPTSNANIVVAAVYKEPGTALPRALWSKEVVLLGPTNTPLTACQSANQTNEIKIHTNPATLPADFTMADDEIVIVAEVCVEGTSTAFPEAVYAHYIVPSRDDDLASRLGAT